jgi:hypothetical protein
VSGESLEALVEAGVADMEEMEADTLEVLVVVVAMEEEEEEVVVVVVVVVTEEGEGAAAAAMEGAEG